MRDTKKYSILVVGVRRMAAAKKMSDLLPGIVNDLGRRQGDGGEAVFALWRFLIGGAWASLTEPVSYFDQVLTIKVKSATLYTLLSVHEKPRLLKQLQEKFPVRKLVFRVG